MSTTEEQGMRQFYLQSFEEAADELRTYSDPLPSERPSVIRQANEIASGMVAEHVALETEDAGSGMSRVMDFARRFRPAMAAAAVFTPVAAGALYEAIPAGAASVATASSQQECISADTAAPQIRNSQMRAAGVAGAQNVYAQVISNDTPSNCSSQFNVEHAERYRFVVQNPLHRSHWDGFLGNFWRAFNRGPSGGFRAIHLTSEGKHDKGLYECSKGSQTTGAKVEVEELALNAQTNQVIAEKTYDENIDKIFPKPC